ncbi:Fe(2+) transporter permease subunit FeoB [Desulfobulbus sp.]|uniref:Fe(2+) transporter permease subunit FeoB n=1 Tax=Desulfobulbus sp. TaxID=895 RepID=UPI0027B8ADC0|nr:Fe(2+) transporter permease subunit FeoB [Desulfobulbus sp.]
MKQLVIGVVGNPNCGKTTLFNCFTGAKQRVGNWPGVTVDRKSGAYRFEDGKVEVIDTPGIYSLAASSLDEQVTRDFILSREADLIVNIVDASNIERNLYLTSQLLEMRVPMLIALNMMDMAAERRLEIDVQGLAQRLGCPVVPLTASKNQGIDELKAAIRDAAGKTDLPIAETLYPPLVQEAREQLAKDLQDICAVNRIDPSWLALKLLEGDEQPAKHIVLGETIATRIATLRAAVEQQEDEEIDIVIASARYGFISWLTQDLIKNRGQLNTTLSDRIDRVVLSRIFGIPIFLAAMYLMFMFTINLGGAFIDFFDQLAGTIFVDGFAEVLGGLGAPEWLIAALATGIGGGVQTMATFIPPIGFMFLFLSFLEDSGYMARAAFVMDRFMRFIGLPGKAFVPMLVGFGCNVPAIMATRTLENERDRTLTVMMNPFMSCGARLPVYALFAAAFFPTGGQNLVFLLYLVGIGFAVLTGLILKNTLLKGEVTPFVMEMPPYHLPTAQSVLLRAYDRLKTFLFRAGKVLIPVIMVLSFLNSLGTDGSFGNEDTDKSALASMSKVITPVLKPLGVTEENWPATVGIFTGIFAKEAVVGTLDALYTGLDQQAATSEDAPEQEAFDFWGGISSAFATIPENLLGVLDTVADPLGLSVGDLSDTSVAAEEQEVSVATFGSMVKLFGSQSAAFAYLLFVLLYFPCSAAIAAVYRETTLAWTAFAGFWTTFLAYLASTLFYQTANFSAHPGYSLLVIAADLGVFASAIFVMKFLSAGRRTPQGALANAATAAPGLAGKQ